LIGEKYNYVERGKNRTEIVGEVSELWIVNQINVSPMAYGLWSVAFAAGLITRPPSCNRARHPPTLGLLNE
jgi:hypothetical protein